MIESLIEYASTKSWFPTSQGLPIPGTKELLVFVLIVAAMFVRGASEMSYRQVLRPRALEEARIRELMDQDQAEPSATYDVTPEHHEV